MQRTLFAVLATTVATGALANTRDLGSHEHGAASLDIVLFDNTLEAVLDTPWANLVGFEHAPSTDEQHAAVEAALDYLQNGELALGLDGSAGCKMASAELPTGIEVTEEHDEHDEHQSSHSDAVVSWTFTCEDIALVSDLTPGLFGNFESLESLRVQLAGPKGQSAQEVTQDSPTIALSDVR